MKPKTIRAAIATAITIAVSAILPSFADRTLNDGLAVYMPFDTSPTENVVVGSVVAPTASGSPTSVAGGIVGSNCLNIPSGSYVKLNNSNTGSLTFEDSNKSFTAIVWANFGGVSSDPLLWANKNWDSGSNKGALLCVSSSTGVRFNAGTGSARIDKDFSGEGSGHWTFYAAVCNNGSFTFYQGKSDGTSNTQTASLSGFTLASGYPFYLGQDGRGSYSSKFVGKLDDFALWTRPLSTVAVKRIFEYGQLGASIGDLLSVETNSTVSAVMVASSLDGAEGTDPNGLYIVDNTRTFTSPASATVGGHVYTLTGYTLETFNTTTGAWDSDGEGVHVGASYVHTSSANDTDVRITWQWMDADEPTIAVWTGAANNNTFTDPANWSCTNTIGQATVNAVPPDERTVKYILAADADWTSTNLTLAAGVTLDLNGHNLAVENITGSGTVVDLANDQSVILAPDGAIYQKIQYVQATQEGANNKSTAAINKIQYVDTGYNHTSNTVVDIRVEFQDVSYSDNYGYAVFYGCRYLSTSAATACQLGGWIHSSKFYYYDTGEHDGSAAKVNTIYDVHLDKGGASYANYADGTRAAGLGTGNKNGPNTWGTDYIFANNQVSNGGKYWPCKCKVYSCTVCEGDEPKRDFVPVICISGANAGKAGFWCTVTEAFYGNSGYGTLTAGPAKKSATPAASSLTITVGENETLSLANVAQIGGNIEVVKAGAGTLTVPTTGVYFTGGVDVQAGTLSIPGPVTSLEGSNLGNVTVASGAKATIPATDGAKYGEAFTLNGGTLELVCSGTAEPVTTYITNSVALNAGAKIRFDTSSLASLTFLLSTDGFTLGEGVESAVSCAELSAPTETIAEASGANGILVTVVAAPVTAVWTGAANNNDFNDPDNWSCTNVLGGALSGAVPNADTVKYTLAADADWTSTNLTLAAGVTLDLNGHNLVVTNITGGAILDTTDGYIGTDGHNLFIGSDGTFYLEMEYLQSHRTTSTSYNYGSQYIDTGYRHNANTVVDMKVAISDTPGNWYAYYGSRTGEGAQNELAGWVYNGNHWKGVGGVKGSTSWSYTKNTPFLVRLDGAAGATVQLGANTFTHANAVTDSGKNDFLFNVNQSGASDSWQAQAKIYYCTVKEGDTVMRDFVPVKRISDGKPGMLDKEHGVFYVNGRSSEAAHDFLFIPEKKSATPAASSVTFSVTDETTLSLANVAPICGNIKVVKAGAGTLTVPTTGVYFTGGIDVSAGTLSIAGPVTSLEGSNLGNVTVASGAKVTIPAADGAKYGESFTLNGGTLELVCSGTAVPVTTYITNSVALNAGAKIRFDTTALDSTQFKLSTTGFTLGEGVASAVSCAELSSPTETIAEADGANGILVTVLTEPATATYTGLGTNPLDFTDPDNWACTNAVGGELTGKIPTSNTAVTIPGDTAFQLASGGTMFDCLNVKFENVTFDDGADLRGFDFSKLASGSRIDLQGRTLYVANAAVSGLTITDSTGDTEHPGELHWTVASGTYTNDKTALSGNMKFVKEGLGTFVGAKAQTYTGDTIIAAGTARPPDGSGSNTTYCRDQFKAFGTGSIRVAAGATFDLRANYAYYYWIKLDGGTLTNSGNDMTGTTLGGSGIGEITADSTLNVAHHIVFQGNTFNLNGHTLTVTIPGKHWYIHTTTFTNGTVNITQGGWLHTVKNAIDAHTVDFKMNCAIHLEQNLDVRNYEAIYSDSGFNRGSGTMNVHGTFKPSSHNLFYGCTLLDGSTIDLTNRTVATLPMPTTAVFSNSTASYVDGKKTLSFATGNENGTTVTVSFGGKTKDELKAIAENDVDGKTGMLLTWTSEPAADVKFKADAATSALGFKVKRVEGGVRLLKNKGLTIIIQ